jgi:hypothetical protein
MIEGFQFCDDESCMKNNCAECEYFHQAFDKIHGRPISAGCDYPGCSVSFGSEFENVEFISPGSSCPFNCRLALDKIFNSDQIIFNDWVQSHYSVYSDKIIPNKEFKMKEEQFADEFKIKNVKLRKGNGVSDYYVRGSLWSKVDEIEGFRRLSGREYQ